VIVLLGRSGLGHHSEAFAEVDGDTLQRECGGLDAAVEDDDRGVVADPVGVFLLYKKIFFSLLHPHASAEMTATEMMSYGLSASEAKRLIAIRDDAAENGIIQYAFKGSRSSIV
jgi:hypothetical protein